MISAEYYQIVYLIVISILLLIKGSRYSSMPASRFCSQEKEDKWPSLLMMIIMALYIGFRPVSGKYFLDMRNYESEWAYWSMSSFNFDWNATNLLFDNLRMWMSTSGVSVSVFFVLIAAIYLGTMWMACRKMFPNDTMFVFLIYLAAFSTFSYGTNGIKAGAATSIFLLALAYQDKLKVAIPLALVSWGFHHSMIMVVAAFIVTRFVKNPRVYYVVWFVSLIIAMLHITWFQEFFTRFSDDIGQTYLSNFDFKDGFRLDFVLYSFMPIVVGYFAVFRKGVRTGTYISLLNMYLLTNSVWLLCMYASFTNRIAYLSWFMYPFVLIYPFLKESWGQKQFHSAKLVAYAHLAFTLFMVFIYYR